MRIPLPSIALPLAMLAVAACSDGAPPGPTGVSPPSLANAPSPTACDPDGIRSSAAALLETTDLKSRFLPDFNTAQSVAKASGVDEAYPLYFSLIAFVLDRFDKGRLTLDPTSSAAHEAMNALVGSLLACAGVPYPAGLDLIIARMGTGDPHYAICPVLDPDAPQNTCVVPSEGAAIWLTQGFLSREALILMEPAFNAEGQFEDEFGTTWSGVWRVRIVPAEAQTYYAYDPPPSEAPSASVAVCPLRRYATFHPEEEDQMRLAQAGEGEFEGELDLLDPSALAASLLGDCATYRSTPAPMPSGVASAEWLGGPLSALLAGRGENVLRSAGHAIGRLFEVQPLWAWDGGIGGGTRRVTSRFAGVEQQGLYLRTSDPTLGRVDALRLRELTSTVLYASQTEFGMLMAGGQCTWVSSHNRVGITVAADTVWKATLTASRSRGEATVTATCTRDGTEYRDDVLVTVTR